MGFGGASAAKVEELIQAAHTITDAAVELVKTAVDLVKNQTDKLSGLAPSESSVIGNWQSGTATSLETGDDLVNIGVAATKYKLNSLQVGISALTAGAIITIRLYELVNGVENKVYPPQGTTWVVGTDPDAIWIVDGPVEITGVLRVEVQSDTVGDNTRAITYKYALEAM